MLIASEAKENWNSNKNDRKDVKKDPSVDGSKAPSEQTMNAASQNSPRSNENKENKVKELLMMPLLDIG